MTTDPNRFIPKIQAQDIHLKRAEKTLDIIFSDQAHFSYPAEYLRVFSPSAEVQGHRTSERKLVYGRRNVGIMELEEVGNYALRIIFDDLHDTGIYSWDYLYQLGQDYQTRWQSYLDELQAAGKSRDPV